MQRSLTLASASSADAVPRSGVIVASGPPLDFSYKELKSCMEVETEEPRGKKPARSKSLNKKADALPANGEEGAAKGPDEKPGGVAKQLAPQKAIVKKVTIAVRLDNNLIENLTELPQALNFIMENPLMNLQWLDLSFNQLSAIDPVLCKYSNLKALYLHGNRIKSLPSVERLRVLPKLLSFTLNENPVIKCRIYRRFIVGALQTLRSLDHSTITDEELEHAYAWYQMHLKREKLKKEEQEQAEYLANSE